MAIGKNKKKFRAKKKVADPFRKKQWYIIKAPGMFMESTVGRTPVNKTAGTKLSRDALMGRVFKVSLGDLNNDEDMSYRNIHLIVEDVQGEEVLTNFHGMSFASHKLKSLVRKWRTLIEAFIDVNTTDGYKVRLFVIGFTRRRPNQEKSTSYATTAQIKQIRKKIFEIVKRESGDSDLKGLFRKLILETISARIETETQGIYPLHNVYIHKLKVLNKPAFDRFKLAEVHAEAPEDFGQSVVKRTEEEEVQYQTPEGMEEPEIAPITVREFTDDPEQM
jgi:small subunit ribosomal protein S3Ae